MSPAMVTSVGGACAMEVRINRADMTLLGHFSAHGSEAAALRDQW
jgi:hypothetical protein